MVERRRGRLTVDERDGDGARGQPRSSRPAERSASRSRRSATARRSPRRTPAACAWSRSRARGCSCRPARGGSSRAWSCTDTERARHSRRLVLELLGSSVDLSIAAQRRAVERRVRRRPRPLRRRRVATVEQPAKVDNDLYVRDYAKCILCYKCVDACGEQWQNTFAISVAGRGLRRPDLDRARRRAARVGVRLLRQLHRGLPDRGADVQERVRPAGRRHVGRGRARPRPTRSAPTAASAARFTLHVQDNEIVKVTSPLDHAITSRQPLHQGPLRLPARAEPLAGEPEVNHGLAPTPPPVRPVGIFPGFGRGGHDAGVDPSRR